MKRVLVVTKNAGLRTFLQLTFGSQLTIDATSTMSQALSWIVKRSPRLVILDVLAADRNLSPLLSILRTRLPRCEAIVLTEDLNKWMLAGLDSPATVEIPLCHPCDLRQISLHVGTLVDSEPRRAVALPVSRTVEKLVAHMGAHYSEHFRLQDLSAVIGLSSTHLGHVFRSAVGTSVMQFLTMMRVEAAKDLLTQTDAKLSDVAERVGFCDSAHLSRAFYRLTGCRPGQYRRRVLGLGL